ncbi:MAG: hypothetical protein GTO40_07415 [Deltaproteobacteria bacterium]|nr:hypothetical protein [Deltaproteobacteria bacterium]
MESGWQKTNVDEGTMGVYVSVPDGGGPFPAVVVLQHRDGVDAFVREMTRRLAGEGYVAAAPELYHRDGPDCKDDGPTRAQRLQDANVIKDVNESVRYLQGHSKVQRERLGIVGFCQGGRGCYLMAGVSSSFKAGVLYYSGNTFTARGDGPSPFERTKDVHFPLMGHFGEEDENPSPEDVGKIDAELTKYHKAHEFFSYRGAGHAFMNFEAPSYRGDADKTSWHRTLSFLKKHV